MRVRVERQMELEDQPYLLEMGGVPLAVMTLKELRETADKLSAIVKMFEKSK